jgi:hypothetical protein
MRHEFRVSCLDRTPHKILHKFETLYITIYLACFLHWVGVDDHEAPLYVGAAGESADVEVLAGSAAI